VNTAIQFAANATALGSLYAVLAIGIALIFGIMNLMNFAYGELITIGGYTLLLLSGTPWPVQFAGCIFAAVAAALVMDRLAFRPFRGSSGPVLLVTSFALSFAIQAILTVAFSSRAQGVLLPGWLVAAIQVGPATISVLNVVTVCAALVLVGTLAALMRYTMIGIQMRAAAENFSTARLMGVRSNRVIAVAFALSGFFAGVTAILLIAQGGTVTPSTGSAPVLIAFIATVIGGMGSLAGAAWGGFLLGVAAVTLQTVLPQGIVAYRDAFLYAGVVAILLVRPQGLIALRSRMERV
jgi:branched-chain amino acid transport system permease protein